jgi:hypothetical protein
MDLLGYGKTDNEAVSQLLAEIQCQVTFARQQQDVSILSFPAPKDYFDRWEAAHGAMLKNLVSDETTAMLNVRAVFISIERMNAKRGAAFRAMELTCA